MILFLMIQLIFLAVIDLLFFIIVATGYGVVFIVVTQLISAGVGWMQLRKLDFNLFFYVESTLRKREPIIREVWDEILLLSGACLLLYPGIFSDLIGALLYFKEVRVTILDFLL